MATFKYAPKDRYTTKVKVSIPGDNGQSQKVVINVTFKRLDVPGAREVISQIANATAADDATGDVLRANVVDWSGVESEDGGDVPFSKAALDEMLAITCYRQALIGQFFDDLRAPQDLARKN